ncbi:UvrD-helicase domain-containing protein [Salinimicrobium flavum]|uniref:DNA 3'-5' helicase n=1 Tax=Salinimicrobium flavum TaxID=1737065 RepID=A0ABW5IUZ8_9FLAO
MKAPNSFTIYNASAGSGKTFTLVKEYLVLLLTSGQRDSYRNILAITFTNKAVAEMKSRIIESLFSLSAAERSSGGENLIKLLCEETGLSSEEIGKRSYQLLKSIINNYAAFEVSTIDGFTHRVLRTFARDLDLPLNFEVELNTEEVLSEAVDRLVSKAGEDSALTRILVNFVLGKTDDDKSWDISRDLLKIARLLTQETSRDFLEVLKTKSISDFEKLRKTIKQQQKDLQLAINDLANSFFELLSNNAVEMTDFSGGYCPKFFLKLQKGDLNVNFTATWQLNLAEKPLYANKLSDGKKEILDEIQPQIVEIYKKAQSRITTLQLLEAVEKNLVPISLLSAIQQEIEAIKKENAVVLISEFNATIGKAVKDQPAPFIYERLGERYRHYFIDEFQDTSQLQWENLIPLVDHTLTMEHTLNQHGSLTLVGDAKQSIYRWRGGKAEQFMELCGDKNPFSLEHKKVVVLPKNYRSAKNIVKFNNEFFNFSAACFEKGEHRDLFTASAQEPVSSQEGYLNISFVEAENAEAEMEAYPKRVLEILQDLEARQVPKSSVCILTRRRKESIVIANFLSEHGIPVISAESLLLSRSPEVMFVNDILNFSLDTRDRDLKSRILDFLLKHSVSVENEFLFLMSKLNMEGQSFFDALKPFDIHFSLDTLDSLSVYEGVEYIIRSFKLAGKTNAYLQFYLDFVYETAHSSGAGIFGFLEQWERKKDTLSIVVPKGEAAVQILTIHKAKGLEFPVVIYPFANTQIKDTARESVWMNLPEKLGNEIGIAYLGASEKMKNWGDDACRLYEELCFNSQLDALNVLYVALTRPEQQLYVISKMEIDRKGNENLNKFSGLFISYLREIGKWDGGLEYEFGKPDEEIVGEKEPCRSVKQEFFYSSPTESNGLSIVTRAGMLWDSRQEAAIEKGKLIHDLFARINSEKDIDRVLLNAREEGIFIDQDEGEVKNTIFQVVHHPQLKEYYSESSQNYNERDIVTGRGEILRPDRLNFSGKLVSIIDYKTGAEDHKHRYQINSYAEVLEEMGYQIDKKLLVYLNEGAAVTVV